MFNFNTQAEVLAFIDEDQDATLAEFIRDRVKAEVWTLAINEDNVWELRGDYKTLAIISNDSGVEVNDNLLSLVYGAA